MEQEKKRDCAEQVFEGLKNQPEDKREILAAHMMGIIKGVEMAGMIEKKPA